MTNKTDTLDLEGLIVEHKKIDEEVDQLGARRYLTPPERSRLKFLKVQKLRIKDAICSLEE